MSKRIKIKQADIAVSGGGAIRILDPLTDTGRKWMSNKLHAEPWQRVGDGIVIDSRMAEDIIDGAEADGLTVSPC